MPIFISWSGRCSKQYAEVISEWVRQVAPGETTFFSPQIQAGTIGVIEMLQNLEKATFSILCLTPSNLNAGWLHFEAGAVLNNLGASIGGTSRPPVVPLMCHGVSVNDLVDPLRMLQAKACDHEGFLEIAKSINSSRDGFLADDVLAKQFDLLWPQLASRLADIKCDDEPRNDSGRVANEPSEMERIVQRIEALESRTIANLQSGHLSSPSVPQMVENLTRALQTRAERAGHTVVRSTEFGPDLTIDGKILIEVKGVRSTSDVARRAREAAMQVRKWAESAGANAMIIVALVGPGARPQSGIGSDAFLWSEDGTTVFGDTWASLEVPYLLDNRMR